MVYVVYARELAYKGQIPGVRNLAGKHRSLEGGIIYGYDRSIADMLTRIRNALVRNRNMLMFQLLI